MEKAGILLTVLVAAYAVLSFGLLQLESEVEERSGYALVDGISVYYAEWNPKSGTRKGVAVLLHGLGGSLEMMRWLGVELARNGYRAIAYDNLGHGRSGSRLAMLNGSAAATVYFELLKLLGVQEGEGVTLVGHSMGGFFAQEIAKRDERVKRVFIVASRPYLDAPLERVAIFAALDEIFSPIPVGNWSIVVMPYDDHLSILYNPALAGVVLARIEGEHYANRAPQRLIATLVRSACAIAAALSAVYLISPRLRKPVPRDSRSLPLARVFSAAVLAAPLTFPLYLLMAQAVSLIASYVLAVLYTQAAALIVVLRPRLRLSFAGLEARSLLKLLASSTALALIVYAGLHEALQPFFNVEPGPLRVGLLASILALSLLPAAIFESLARLRLSGLSLKRGLAIVTALRSSSFLTAWAIARLALGLQGLAGYLLIVTLVSLILLLPLDAAAQVWVRRTGSWGENAVCLMLVHSALLAAVTPLT